MRLCDVCHEYADWECWECEADLCAKCAKRVGPRVLCPDCYQEYLESKKERT